jgi:tol-pal system protein YbgF
MTIRFRTIVAAAALAGATVSTAGAQDARLLAQTAAELSRDLAAVRVQIAQAVPQSYINASEERFNQLDRQTRELTGRLERLEIQLRQLIQLNERQQSDLELRLSELEQRGGRQPTGPRGQPQPPPRRSEAPTPPSAPNAPSAPVAQGRDARSGDVQVFNAPAARPGEPRFVLERGPEGRALSGGAPAPVQASAPQQASQPAAGFQTSGAPEDDYEDAYEIVRDVQARRANPGEAEQAMRSFAQAYPNHRLANDARFWQGEMLYRQRNYPQAQSVFAGLLQRAPNSERAPEAMLRIAQSMRAPNQRQQACGMLTLLPQRYPQAPQRVKTEAAQERTRLRCQT